MSDSLPKPLSSINALRAHLKLLERGVNAARERRVGPAPVPQARPSGPASARPVQSQAAPASYPMAGRAAAAAADGKPKAKAKATGDFSEFFGNIEKRAAS